MIYSALLLNIASVFDRCISYKPGRWRQNRSRKTLSFVYHNVGWYKGKDVAIRATPVCKKQGINRADSLRRMFVMNLFPVALFFQSDFCFLPHPIQN